jgi:hypothetical protein
MMFPLQTNHKIVFRPKSGSALNLCGWLQRRLGGRIIVKGIIGTAQPKQCNLNYALHVTACRQAEA